MNISPVSFSSAAAGTGSFQDKIRQPQAYSVTDTSTAAASGLNGNGEGKKSTAKKVVTAVIVAVAAATGLAVGARKGLFKQVEGGKFNTIKQGLETAGNVIADKAITAKNFIASKLSNEEIVEDIKETLE